MGVDYLLSPVNDEMRAYAVQTGVLLPEEVPEGRFPTADELLSVAHSFPEHQVCRGNSKQGFELTIESDAHVPMEPIPPFKQTSTPASYLDIAVKSFRSDGAENVSFHGHADFMVEVIFRLTQTCGGLVFFATDDALPWFVLPSHKTPIGSEEWVIFDNNLENR